jgi:hypothetical protein
MKCRIAGVDCVSHVHYVATTIAGWNWRPELKASQVLLCCFNFKLSFTFYTSYQKAVVSEIVTQLIQNRCHDFCSLIKSLACEEVQLDAEVAPAILALLVEPPRIPRRQPWTPRRLVKMSTVSNSVYCPTGTLVPGPCLGRHR